ncbi:MAG: helix-turn-helix transcriptional regulator [Deltaproteobacteria bacterium]
MREVLNQAAHQIVLAAAAEGIDDRRPFFEGLPFSERTLARRPFGRIDWDPFTVMLERIAAALGGPEQMARTGRHFYRHHPTIGSMLRLAVSPRNVYRIVHGSFSPWLWPGLRQEQSFLPGGRVRLRFELPANRRGSLPFWHGVEAAEASLPCFVGLPPAVATVDERTPHRLRMSLRLPRSRTIAAKLRATEPLLRALELQWAGRLAELKTWLAEAAEGEPPSPSPALLERARAAWRLTPREAEVVALVLKGHSNPQIAARLGCARGTVEAHLSRIFEKANVDGRAQLARRLWRGGD